MVAVGICIDMMIPYIVLLEDCNKRLGLDKSLGVYISVICLSRLGYSTCIYR